jgi:succinoglycan biosynthesis protein ExoM
MNEQAQVPQLTVAVCTSNRPARLRELLASLSALDPPGVEWCVLVIDNPPSVETRAVVAACGVKADYISEDRASISGARNRAIRETLERGAKALIFVDDDELVDRRWLVEIWNAHCANPDDVLVGPVEILLDPSLPEWMVRTIGKEFTLPPDGHSMITCNSGNTLVPASALGSIWFDARFDVSGGEDTDFFRRLSRMGGVNIRVCSRAHVTERWDLARANPSFLRARARRSGWLHASVIIDQDGKAAMPRVALSLFKNIGQAAMFALGGLVRGDRALLERAAERWNRCAGKTARLAGRAQPRKSDWAGKTESRARADV